VLKKQVKRDQMAALFAKLPELRIPDQRDRLFRANVTGHSGAT
jgi:hypothetical protein